MPYVPPSFRQVYESAKKKYQDEKKQEPKISAPPQTEYVYPKKPKPKPSSSKTKTSNSKHPSSSNSNVTPQLNISTLPTKTDTSGLLHIDTSKVKIPDVGDTVRTSISEPGLTSGTTALPEQLPFTHKGSVIRTIEEKGTQGITVKDIERTRKKYTPHISKPSKEPPKPKLIENKHR